MGREQRDLGEDWSGATKGCIGVAVRLSSASLPLTLLSGVAFFFVWAGRGRGGGAVAQATGAAPVFMVEGQLNRVVSFYYFHFIYLSCRLRLLIELYLTSHELVKTVLYCYDSILNN